MPNTADFKLNNRKVGWFRAGAHWLGMACWGTSVDFASIYYLYNILVCQESEVATLS